MSTKPVWVFQPGQSRPIRCGELELEGGVGLFRYDEAYLKAPGALALDPLAMPLGSRVRTMKETAQGGLFGVVRDAKPEGYGLDLLASISKLDPSDHLMVMERAEGDTIGGIEVCEDVDAKISFTPPSSDELLQALESVQDARPSSDAVREVKGIHGTSAGGERPKLTVVHKGQWWLAKLQDRGDRPHAPLREYVSMRVARHLGVDAAEVKFRHVGSREVLLVRRFDRRVTEAGEVTRHLYASAHTVLRLDRHVRGDRERSYVALATELSRWCATALRKDVTALRRELWRRIAVNSILGNGDDHPRNTGLLHDGEGWGLSPAFDIAPYGGDVFKGVHAMDISRSREHPASGATFNLVVAAPDYGYEADEAMTFIADARAKLPGLWRNELAAIGLAEDVILPQEPVWLDTPAPPQANRARRRP